jgi:putative transposase
VKYRFVEQQRPYHRVVVLCRVLDVSTSGYYAWRGRPESQRAVTDRRLTLAIKAVFTANHETYGSPRVWRELRELRELREPIICSRKRVARLMRVAGLRSVRKPKFKRTTDSQHAHPIAPNRLPDIVIVRCNQVWVTDITYIWTREGWMYLAVVMDLHSRRIVGWVVRPRLTRELVLEALRRAIAVRRPQPGLIHHSDRGSQYAAGEYQAVLRAHGMMPSMSGKGNCYDNAAMESCFATVKLERVHRRHYQTRGEVTPDLCDYIEGFYNSRRRHSSLGCQSPVDFEMKQHLS